MREQGLKRFNDYKSIKSSSPHYLVYRYLLKDLEESIKQFANGRVLDIGCGNKPYEPMFQGKTTEYVGCDIAQSSENKVDVLCEATSIPLLDQSFDTIFSTQTIEHVADHQLMLNEAYRLLKPGGVIIVSGPMYWHLHEEPYDFFRFTKYGFIHVLNKAGFKDIIIKANGGKWALFGQVCMHTFPSAITRWSFVRAAINKMSAFLDKKNHNEYNTTNYVAIAKK